MDCSLINSYIVDMSDIKLENLEINDYMIYQDKDSFNFGIDAVLLANFALREAGANSSSLHICDFCTGALPIPLIMNNGDGVLKP